MDEVESVVPDKTRLRRELAILNTSYYQDALPEFVSYLERLQAATSVADMWLLQHDLLTDLNARQKALREFVDDHQPATKAKIDRLLREEPKRKNELANANRMLRSMEHVEAVAAALQHATRTLADG